MSILIVDDTASQQLLLSAVLRSAGYSDLLTAASAEQAFARLSGDGPAGGGTAVDLILMDISMPDVDGIETCRQIKATAAWQDIPVIMVTASTDSEDLQALGFVDIAGALDQRHLVLARRAPGGPEIQQDRLAAVLAEPDPAAVERLGGEVGRGLADSSVPAVEGDVDRRTLVEELGPN